MKWSRWQSTGRIAKQCGELEGGLQEGTRVLSSPREGLLPRDGLTATGFPLVLSILHTVH